MMDHVILRMLQDTAGHLSGQPVRVLMREPFSSKARGCCYVNQEGIPTIRIRPGLWDDDRETFWRVYLHEIAHLREHVNDLAVSDGDVLPLKRSGDLRGMMLDVSDGFDELTADIWAETWRRFAGNGPIVARLLRLQGWRE